ncbi:MAG: hypothetical protein ABW352_22500 [Polyangiales bacterium]
MSKRLFFTLVCLLGCGDDDGGGSGGDAGNQSNAAVTCARGCTRAAAANCPSQPTDCAQRCEAEISRTPTVCLSAAGAYASCTTTAVFSCDNSGAAEAASCQPQLAAWLACTGGGVVRDAAVVDAAIPDAAVPDTSVPDTGTPGGEVDTGVPDAGPVGLSCTPAAADVQCDLCIKQRCCETLSTCTSECINLLNCSNACTDEECPSQCTARYPDGLPGVQNILTCMAGPCANDCEGELSQ